MSQSITTLANDAVKEALTILQHYPPLAEAKMEVQVEGDDLAIIELSGEDLFIEVHLEDTTVGIKRTPYKQPKYVPGYFKHHWGGRMNPPEVEDFPLLECATVLQAVTQLVAEEFSNRVTNILEADGLAESYAEVEGIFADQG